MTIERDAVIWGYRFLLGREPESEEVVQAHMQHRDLETFRTALIDCPECQSWLATRQNAVPVFTSYGKECVVFLHLPKTGGETLKELLAASFKAECVCPERYNLLYGYPPAALSPYDLYAGHFDFFSVRFIPKAKRKIISCFREPRERLISLYYFYRAHPRALKADPSTHVYYLAQHHSIEEFYELPEVRLSTLVWNTYALTFGASMCGYRWDELLINLNGESIDTQALLNTAIRNIRSLHAVGVTEYFNESVELIFAALGVSRPAAIPKRNAFKYLRAENPLFRPIRRKPPTQRLQLALDELVALDERIYEDVLGLFREQCQRHKTSPADQPNMQSPLHALPTS